MPGAKASNQRNHAKRRAGERFGLGQDDVQRIGEMIRAGKSRPIVRQSNRVTVHRVRLDDVVIDAVYDSKRRQVVTLLDPAWGKTKQWKRQGKIPLRYRDADKAGGAGEVPSHT